MSRLSLDPAATTFGWLASIATAGSFCLFCENGPSGLPTLTRVSWAPAALAVAASATAARRPAVATRRRRYSITERSLLGGRWPGSCTRLAAREPPARPRRVRGPALVPDDAHDARRAGAATG